MPSSKSRMALWLGAGALGVISWAVLAPAQEPAHSDTQKILIENMFVRVWDIQNPPGGFEPKHTHGRSVTVALSDYDNETKTFPEGKVARSHTNKGEVKWAEPVTHEARNIGTTEQHVIRIEIK